MDLGPADGGASEMASCSSRSGTTSAAKRRIEASDTGTFADYLKRYFAD